MFDLIVRKIEEDESGKRRNGAIALFDVQNIKPFSTELFQG